MGSSARWQLASDTLACPDSFAALQAARAGSRAEPRLLWIPTRPAYNRRMLRLIRGFEQRVDDDTRDLIFRGLFSSIFLGLGCEHQLDDRLLQHFMPAWVQYPMLASRLSGVVL